MTIRGEYWWIYCRSGGIDWAHCPGAGTVPPEEGSCRDWSDLPIPDGAAVVLCVPGEYVRIHTVCIPTRNRRRFLAAMPYELEEQLLEDAEAYHFVPLPRSRHSSVTSVAAVERRRMEGWLERLKERGWRPLLLFPDYFAIDEPAEDEWLLDVSTSPFLLRRSTGRGGAVLSGKLDGRPPGALLLALEEARPNSLRVRTLDRMQSERVSQWRETLAQCGVDLRVLVDDSARPAWLARQPLPHKSCSLLTGPFAIQGEERLWRRRLLPATFLGATLLLVLCVHWFIEGSRIESEYLQLQRSIDAVYRQAFPDARHLVDPRYQMEQRLKTLRAAGSQQEKVDSGLMAWFDTLAPVLAGDDRYTLESLRYDGGRITLEVSVTDYEALERLQEELAGAGAVIEVETAELREDRVYGRLRAGGRT